ncbi:MAG: hypothetical protein ABF876_10675 [Acetobacter aceti]|uniref:Uncharacterized protein n=1 Tax=Acetobacter aceti TaxID=435 RepID=A0A1U9KJB3_ACEAC|nr:hypothetical protein [Acetobacter aceti]AQS85880.1 hypothetical protein A0U92_15150 [Acetobacter aceti]
MTSIGVCAILVMMLVLPMLGGVWIAARAVGPVFRILYGAGRQAWELSGGWKTGGWKTEWRPCLRGWLMWSVAVAMVGWAAGHPFAPFPLFMPSFVIWRCFLFLQRYSGGDIQAAGTTPVEQFIRDDENAALRNAWRTAQDHGVSPETIARARKHCSALLRAHKQAPLDLPVLEWVAFIRKQIPDVVSAYSEHIGTHDDDVSRSVLIVGLERALADIGAEAENRVHARRNASEAALTLRLNHLTERSVPKSPVD